MDIFLSVGATHHGAAEAVMVTIPSPHAANDTLSRLYATQNPAHIAAARTASLAAFARREAAVEEIAAADTAETVRGIVADTAEQCGMNACAVVMLRRGIVDDAAFKALAYDVLDIDSRRLREIVLSWITDLSAGRFERIVRSDAAWSRPANCVDCAALAFSGEGTHCDDCAESEVSS